MKIEIALRSLFLLIIFNHSSRVYQVEKIKNFIIVCIFILISISFNIKDRYYPGIDNYVYLTFFKSHKAGIGLLHGDIGFDALTKIIAKLGFSEFGYFLILNSIQMFIVIWFFKKYSKNWKSTFVLYILMFYFTNYFNIIRQGLALSFTLIAVDRLIEKKKISFIMYLLISISIHASSVIVIIFILLFKIKKVKYNVLPFVFFFTLAFNKILHQVWIRAIQVVTPTKYQGYIVNSFFMNYRFTISYLIYLLFFTIMIFYTLKKSYKLSQNKENVSKIDMYFLKIIYFGAIYMLFTANFIILRRLNQFFIIYYFIVFVNIFENENNKVVKWLNKIALALIGFA